MAHNVLVQVLSKCQNSFNENVYFDLDGYGLRNSLGQYIDNTLLQNIRYWHRLNNDAHIYAVFYDHASIDRIYEETDAADSIDDAILDIDISLARGNSLLGAVGGAIFNAVSKQKVMLSDARYYYFTSCFLDSGLSIADIEATNDPHKKNDERIFLQWSDIYNCLDLEALNFEAEGRKSNSYFIGQGAYRVYNHPTTLRINATDDNYLNAHCAFFAHFSIARLLNELVQTMTRNNQQTVKQISNTETSNLQNEQRYIEEVKFILEDNGEINEKERAILKKMGQRLGISEQRALELEQSILGSNPFTEAEKEYLEEIKVLSEDGEISDKDRRILSRLANILGITEERALELEKSVK